MVVTLIPVYALAMSVMELSVTINPVNVTLIPEIVKTANVIIHS